MHLKREVIRGHQWQSFIISSVGLQWAEGPSVSISVHQCPSVSISVNQGPICTSMCSVTSVRTPRYSSWKGP
jgi:hypothetical protein